jgi:peptide/nickel transport system permease protein
MTARRRIFFWLWVLAGLHLLVIFAGFIAPYSYDTQDRLHTFAPPSRLHFVDAAGKFHVRPFIYENVPATDDPTEYHEDRATSFPIRFFSSGDAYSLMGLHSRFHLFQVKGPARIYLLGSDGFGRDQFSRLLYGGRVSLASGFVAALFAVLLGVALGGVAGFYGRGADDVIMRVSEIFIVIPWSYLLVAIRAFLPLQMDPAATFVLIVALVGIVGWSRPARLVRGVVLSSKEQNYVLAARGFGASGFYLWRRHILPSTLGVALTQMALLVPHFVLAEVLLSFLGLGIGEPTPSWGNMLAAAQQYQVLVSYWWMLLPGVAPIPFFLAYHLLVDNLHTYLKLEI